MLAWCWNLPRSTTTIARPAHGAWPSAVDYPETFMKSIRYTLLALTALVTTAFLNVPAALADDIEDGEDLGYSCLGCHGIDGYRNAYPSYRVPKLGGQRLAYIETALAAYRDGTRQHPTMNAQGASLSDEDISDIVAWLSENDVADDTETAQTVGGIEAATPCVACHGVGGGATQPTPPVLSGQHADYIEHALHAYRDGTRSGTVMSAFVVALTDEDIEAIAMHYSAQDGLTTLDQD